MMYNKRASFKGETMLEIEKKFVLPPCKAKRYLKALKKKYKKQHILQYYAKNMRFRKIGDRYWRTIKRGQGVVREEIEEPITKEEFCAYWEQREGEAIEKYRYTFRYKKDTYELDEFTGHLKGLLYLEIEFGSLQEAEDFTLPKKIQKFVLDEVSDNPAFTNRSLALHGLPVISHPIEELIAQNEPSSYLSASLKPSFHPFENVYLVLQVWIALLTKVIEANKEAILAKEEDSERLHQLRVALRKIRSFLALLAKELDLPQAKELQKSIKAIMKQTNRARDLDVYLEWMQHYKKIVPPKKLKRLTQSLHKEREAAYIALLHTLQSPQFSLLLFRLHAFAANQPHQRIPSIILAKRALKRQLHKVWERTSRLNSSSKPKKYHRLRIEIKKLRYLMEFFAFVFEPKEYEKLIHKIKKIQEILGRHQDTTVQMEYLQLLVQKNPSEKKALLSLRQHLKRKAKKLRKKFLASSNTNLYDTLPRALCRY